jgi:MFS family permease
MNAFAIWADNFTPLKSRNIRVYLSGQSISLVGNFLQQTALGLLVYQLSQGAALPLGILSACSALPLLLLSPFAGALADRFPHRRLLLACNTVQMAVAFTLAVLTQTQSVQLWQIYSLALALGVAQAVYFPAQQSFFFELAGRGEIRKLININSMVLNVSRTSGPALAGHLVASYGMAVAFWQNGLSFVAVMASLLAVRQLAKIDAIAQQQVGLRDAIGLVLRDVQLRSLYACSTLLHCCGLAMLAMTPALTYGDARETGLVLAAAGGGSLVYAFGLSPFFQRLSRVGVALSLSLAWMGGWLIVAALSPSLPLRLLAMFMFGLATSMAMVGATGTMQYIAPSAMRGRLMGLFSVVGFGLQPLATLAVGALADRIGAARAVALAGAVAVLLSFALLKQRGWAHWRLPSRAESVTPSAVARSAERTAATA